MLDLLSFTAIYVVPAFLVILTVVVTVHELGHYWAARLCGVKMDRFSIGFGRPLLRRTDKHGTEWRLGWIPLGGYVRFSGDTNDASVPDNDDLETLRQLIIEKDGPAAVRRYYHFKPVWQRAIIAAAGPAANFALAFVIFSFILLSAWREVLPVVIGAVEPGTPAASAGLVPGDKIISANGRKLEFWDDLTFFNTQRAGDHVRYIVERDGRNFDVSVTLQRRQDPDGLTGFLVKRGVLGVSPNLSLAYQFKSPPAQVPARAAGMVAKTVEAPVRYIGRIFSGRENGDQLSGIIGIATTTGKVAEQSVRVQRAEGLGVDFTLLNMISLMAALSVGIGFVNLLPIPVLDGGHLAFYAYEAVARRPVGAKVQAASYKVGLALVLGLMLFAGWNDLQRLQAFRFLGGFFS